MPNIPLHHIDRDEIDEQRTRWAGEDTPVKRFFWKSRKPTPKWAKKEQFSKVPENITTETRLWADMALQSWVVATQKTSPQNRWVVFDTLIAYRELSSNTINIPNLQTQYVEISQWDIHPKITTIQQELTDHLENDVHLYACKYMWDDTRESIACIYTGRLWDIYDPNKTRVDDMLQEETQGISYVLHFPQTNWERVNCVKAGVVRDIDSILTQSDTPPKRAIFTEDFQLPSDPPESHLSTLNASQNQAFALAGDTERYPVVFIHGPSGTGKTETVARILQHHLGNWSKICVLSHSNKWCQMPLQRLIEIDSYTDQQIGIYTSSTHVHPSLKWSVIPRMSSWTLSDKAIIKRNLWIPNRGYSSARDQHGYRMNAYDYGYDHWMNGNWPTYSTHVYGYGYDNWMKERWLKYRPHVVWLTFDTLHFAREIQRWSFDIVIVDEATRMQAPELILALSLAKRQVIFVGDPLQLGNMKVLRDRVGNIHPSLVEIFEKWPFSTFIQGNKNPVENLPYVFLDTNYRSRPNLTAIVSGLIYDGNLKSGNKYDNGIAVWYDTSNVVDAKEKEEGTSKINITEATLVVNKVLDLIKKRLFEPKDIGIISTYKAQSLRIKKIVRKKLAYTTPENRRLYEEIIKNIGTVDSFQWDERKVMIISLTRSNNEGKVGFLSNEARIWVALGRAQEAMFVYGDSRTLMASWKESSQFFTRMRDLFQKHGKIVNYSSD